MRYLIFNITVLVALAYLFTGSSNQSFTQWITTTLDVWSDTPPTDTTIANDSIAETGTVFAKAVAKAASESLEALDDKTQGSLASEPNPLKRQVSMNADEIKQLIVTAMKEAAAEEVTSVPAKISKSTPFEDLHEKPPVNGTEETHTVNKTKTVLPQAEVSEGLDEIVQQQPIKDPGKMNDAEIAAAFSAFEKIENDTLEKSEIVVFQDEKSFQPSEQTPAFMSPRQRAEDMSQIIQQLNMLYLEHTGI